MAGPTLDEGVEKLQEFVSLLASTNSHLQAGIPALQSHGDGVERLEQTAEDQLGGLNDQMEGFRKELEESHHDAVEETEGLAQSARAVIDARLSAVEDQVEAFEREFESKLASDRAELEKGFAELTDSGFQPLAATVEAAQAETTRLDDQTEQAFDGLGDALQTDQQQVEDLRSQTSQAVQDTEEAVENETREVDGEAAGLLGELSGLSEELESQCTSSGDTLDDLYRGWAEDVEGEEKEVTEGVSKLAGETAVFVSDENADPLQQAVGQAEEVSLQGLVSELEDTQAVVEQGEQTTEALGPMVEQLEIVERKVTEIDRLLDSLNQ